MFQGIPNPPSSLLITQNAEKGVALITWYRASANGKLSHYQVGKVFVNNPLGNQTRIAVIFDFDVSYDSDVSAKRIVSTFIDTFFVF